MAIPDFSVKSDPAILQAFQNAIAQKQQAEAQNKQVELNKRQQEFNMVKDTATAVGSMVSSFVQDAEKRKRNQIIEDSTAFLANGEPKTTIQPSGALKPFANPVKDEILAQREKAKMDLANALNPAALGKEMAESAISETKPGSVSGRDIQQFWMVSPDGKQRISVNYDEPNNVMTELSSGNPIDRTKLAGWQMVRATPSVQKNAAGDFVTIDQVTGTAGNTISSGATKIPEEKYGTVKSLNDPLLPAEDRKQLVTQVTEIERDESIKNAKKLVPTLDNVIRYIDTNNKVAIDRLGGLVQKLVALDSGNLATWEQRQPGSAEVIERIEQFFTMGVNGTLTDDNKQELKELLAITAKNLSENVKESSAVTLNRLEASYPQMNRQYLEELAGLKDFYRYINNPKRNISSSTKSKAPAGISIDQNALDAEIKKRGL